MIALAIGDGLSVYHFHKTRVNDLLHDLRTKTVEIDGAPSIEELQGYLNGYLNLGRDDLEKWIFSNDDRENLIAALAFLPEKPSHVDFLVKRLLRFRCREPDEFHVIFQELVKHRHAVGNDHLAKLIGVAPDQQIKEIKAILKALQANQANQANQAKRTQDVNR